MNAADVLLVVVAPAVPVLVVPALVVSLRR